MKNLVDDKEVSLATLTDGPERVEAELLPIAQYEEISLSQQKQYKKALASQKQKAMFLLDQRKLEEAQKIIAGIEHISDMFADTEVMDKIKANIRGPMDLKFLAESYAKLIDSQQKLMRLDSVDGQGNAAKINIGVRYEDESGTKVQTFINVG